MSRQSAGILLYRRKGNSLEVFLGHPGGPFFAKKDKGAWHIPKGEFTEGEDMLAAAKREFREEIGQMPPKDGYEELGSAKNKSGKVIHIWTAEDKRNTTYVSSNTFSMEWPPRSGNIQDFPEIDGADWFALDKAREKITEAQSVFIERLAEKLGTEMADDSFEQASLF